MKLKLIKYKENTINISKVVVYFRKCYIYSQMQDKLETFFSNFPTIELTKNKEVLSPDQEITHIFYIIKGYIRSYSISEDGQEITLNIYRAGSYIPLSLALTRENNPYFYETMTETKVSKAPLTKVVKFIKNEPELMFNLIKRLSSGIEGFVVRTQFLLRSDAKQKVASNLYLMSIRFGKKLKNKKVKIILPLIHQDIANLSGLSRETTSIVLKELEKSGIATRKGKFWTINNSGKLKRIAQIDTCKKCPSFSF